MKYFVNINSFNRAKIDDHIILIVEYIKLFGDQESGKKTLTIKVGKNMTQQIKQQIAAELGIDSNQIFVFGD